MEQKYYKILTSKNTSFERGFDYTPLSPREWKARKGNTIYYEPDSL